LNHLEEEEEEEEEQGNLSFSNPSINREVQLKYVQPSQLALYHKLGYPKTSLQTGGAKTISTDESGSDESGSDESGSDESESDEEAEYDHWEYINERAKTSYAESQDASMNDCFLAEFKNVFNMIDQLVEDQTYKTVRKSMNKLLKEDKDLDENEALAGSIHIHRGRILENMEEQAMDE
jgi:hypothetical protein